MKIAVITDSVSDQYFFPHWTQYYGSLFGDQNLFIVTYRNSVFQAQNLGGVIRLPTSYNEDVRVGAIGGIIATLLSAYDLVVRVDTDEMLVVDPRVAPDLKAYLLSSTEPYLTARGFDVVHTIGEAALVDGRILSQRAFAYPNSALNKTAVTRQSLNWSHGFHWASVPPVFGPLFLLHLKRADIDWQCQWCAEMTRNISGDPMVSRSALDYYDTSRDRILSYHKAVSERLRLKGLDAWYREAHQKRFLESITQTGSLYGGEYAHEDVLIRIPAEWAALL